MIMKRCIHNGTPFTVEKISPREDRTRSARSAGQHLTSLSYRGSSKEKGRGEGQGVGGWEEGQKGRKAKIGQLKQGE